MNKKRWVTLSIIVIILICGVIGFLWYRQYAYTQEIKHRNDKFDTAYSYVIGTSISFSIEADKIGRSYSDIIGDPVIDDDYLLKKISNKYTELNNSGRIKKYDRQKKIMDKRYDQLMLLSTKKIKYGKLKMNEAKRLYKLESDLYDIAADPESSILTFKDEYHSVYEKVLDEQEIAVKYLGKRYEYR